jgi:hypothetical protein
VTFVAVQRLPEHGSTLGSPAARAHHHRRAPSQTLCGFNERLLIQRYCEDRPFSVRSTAVNNALLYLMHEYSKY